MLLLPQYPGIDRAPEPGDEYDRGYPGGPQDTVIILLFVIHLLMLMY